MPRKIRNLVNKWKIPKRTGDSQAIATTAEGDANTPVPDNSTVNIAYQPAQAGSVLNDANATLAVEAIEQSVTENHPSPGSPLPQARDVNLYQKSGDENLKFWDDAYDGLKKLDPELIRTYEKILSHDYERSSDAEEANENLIEQNDRAKRRAQMDRILKKVLEKTKKPNGVEKKVEDAVGVVLSLKDAISLGLQSVPIAALAWTGACMGLQLVSTAFTEKQTRKDGITDVVLKMKWYSGLSQVILDDHREKLASLRKQLAEQIVDFYTTILSFVIKCTCAAYKTTTQFFKDTLKLDDWEDIRRKLLEKETNLRNVIREHGEERKILSLKSLVNMYQSTTERQIASKLFVRNMKAELESLQARKDVLIPESSDWILCHDAFRRFAKWDSENIHRRLWIKGKPGMGKTMLLIGIVQELETEQNTPFDPPYLSFFFCQGTDKKLNSATAVLRGLIWMLLSQDHSLIQHAMELSEQNIGDDLSSFFSLKSIFHEILQSLNMRRVYLIVDALDECESAHGSDEKPGRSYLLDLICETSKDFTNIKWLLSGRDEYDIEMKFFEFPKLELDSELLARPVEAYIMKKMCDLEERYVKERKLASDITPEIQKNICDKLGTVKEKMQQQAGNTFIWVYLIFHRINVEETRLSDLLKLVGETPEKLELIYDGMRCQMETSNDKDYCKKALTIATVANRPLRLAEIQVLAEIPNDIPAHKITKLCRFFRVAESDDGHQTAYIIHESAKQWLESRLKMGFLEKSEGTNHLAYAHISLAKSCLRALDFTLTKKDIWKLGDLGIEIKDIQPHSSVHTPQPHSNVNTLQTNDPSKPVQDPINTVMRPRIAEDPLVPVTYAVLNWFDHISEATVQSDESLLSAIANFMKKRFLYWLEALSLLHQVGKGVVITLGLIKKIPGANPDLLSILRDANRFILYNRGIIEQAPLQAYVSGLVFSPSASRIKTLFEHEQPSWIDTYPLVDINWGPYLQTLAHKDSIFSIAFSHNSKQLASGSEDSTVRIWDVETGELQQLLKGHTQRVQSVTFSHNSRQLASGSTDHTIRIWDIETGELQRIINSHVAPVELLSFSDNSKQLVSRSRDAIVSSWNVETGELQRRFQDSQGDIMTAAFSHDGKWLASTSESSTVRILNVETGELEQNLESFEPCGNVWSVPVAFSYDNKRVATMFTSKLYIWNIETKKRQELGYESEISCSIESIAFSYDGKRLALGMFFGQVHIFNTDTGLLEQTLKGHTSSVLSVAFSYDGKRLASGSTDSTVRIWDAEMEEQQVSSHAKGVNVVTFSHDGKRLVSGSDDKSVGVWNVEKGGEQQKVLKGHTMPVTSVAFSNNGKWLASGSMDDTVRIWGVETEEQQVLKFGESAYLVAFSYDGEQLALSLGSVEVQIWNTKTGELQWTFESQSSIRCITFSYNSKHLTWGSNSNTVCIWDTKKGELQQTLTGHLDPVHSVAFSYNGMRLASGSDDYTIRIWNVETGGLQQVLKLSNRISTLAFSPDERHLCTDKGYIALDQTASSVQVPSWLGYGLDNEIGWITWNGNKVLWIPWEYRPGCSVVKDRTVALGCASGRILFIRFKADILPTTKTEN